MRVVRSDSSLASPPHSSRISFVASSSPGTTEPVSTPRAKRYWASELMVRDRPVWAMAEMKGDIADGDNKTLAAAAKGAAGCLIVHETGPAGYPFAVLGSAWGRESFDLIRPDRNAGLAAIEGWLTIDSATRLLAGAGQDYAKLKAEAGKRDFRPVPLAVTAAFSASGFRAPRIFTVQPSVGALRDR